MFDRLWLVHPEQEMCEAFRERFRGLPGVRVVRGRFEELEPLDAFVTAGNAYGMMSAGIDAAVVQFFGESLMHRVQERILDQYLGEQPVGTAFIEPTGHAHCPYLVHAPTMRTPGSIEGTDKIYVAAWAAMLAVYNFNRSEEARLAQRKIETLAFPAMGTGFGGTAFDEAVRQMARAYQNFLSPPARMDWDYVAIRHRGICYEGSRQVAR